MQLVYKEPFVAYSRILKLYKLFTIAENMRFPDLRAGHATGRPPGGPSVILLSSAANQQKLLTVRSSPLAQRYMCDCIERLEPHSTLTDPPTLYMEAVFQRSRLVGRSDRREIGEGSIQEAIWNSSSELLPSLPPPLILFLTLDPLAMLIAGRG